KAKDLPDVLKGLVEKNRELVQDVEGLRKEIKALRQASPSGDSDKGIYMAGDVLIQWGVARSVKGTYAGHNFPVRFASKPVVTATADGWSNLNDVYVNVRGLSEQGFQFIVARGTNQFDIEPRDCYWIAIGKRKK